MGRTGWREPGPAADGFPFAGWQRSQRRHGAFPFPRSRPRRRPRALRRKAAATHAAAGPPRIERAGQRLARPAGDPPRDAAHVHVPASAPCVPVPAGCAQRPGREPWHPTRWPPGVPASGAGRAASPPGHGGGAGPAGGAEAAVWHGGPQGPARGPGSPGAFKRPQRFAHENRFWMAIFYGRAAA